MKHHFTGHFGNGGKGKPNPKHGDVGFAKGHAAGSLADDMNMKAMGSSYSMSSKPFVQGQAAPVAKPSKIDQTVVDSGADDHAIAHKHMDNARNAGSTDEKRTHVFSALTALNALRKKGK